MWPEHDWVDPLDRGQWDRKPANWLTPEVEEWLEDRRKEGYALEVERRLRAMREVGRGPKVENWELADMRADWVRDHVQWNGPQLEALLEMERLLLDAGTGRRSGCSCGAPNSAPVPSLREQVKAETRAVFASTGCMPPAKTISAIAARCIAAQPREDASSEDN